MTETEAKVLMTLVEAARNLPGSQREPFALSSTSIDPNWFIFHPGLAGNQLAVYPGDAKGLEQSGMFLFHSKAGGHWQFDLSERAYHEYESLKDGLGQPMARVQEPVRRYLDGPRFQSRHPLAYAKWALAEQLLWGSDSEQHYTAIGHHCREAMQAFGTSLLRLYPTPSAQPEIAATKNRIEAVLRQHSTFSGRRAAFLEALLSLWKATVDLSQRQEHGLSAAHSPLTWEDSRRVVQHTASTMYELDGCLP